MSYFHLEGVEIQAHLEILVDKWNLKARPKQVLDDH